MAQFFTKENFFTFYGDLKFDGIVLIQAETYDEDKIAKTIKDIGQKVCLAVALQLAIIGFGNKKYNFVEFEGKKIDIEQWFKDHKINYTYKLNDKLKPNELTPRRLIRFFREAISIYLNSNGSVQSYIFKKYCPNKNDDARKHVFPGFEHMAQPGIDDNYIILLVKTYKALDARLKTNVTERMYRVLSARGFSYDFLTRI